MSAKKFIPYSIQWIDRDEMDAVNKVLRSDWISQGPKIGEFEKKISSYCGARYAVALSSGTAALHIACLAAGIKPGDEVITSPMTFVASANCILYCGGKPIFADIEKDTANIDPEEIKNKITRRTKAIIPVHFAGHPCDLKEIHNIARKHKLIVIEDAAHALGAEYKASKIGSCVYSDMTIFSFHPTKSITTGEGGAVTTDDKNLYKTLLSLRNHGIYKTKSLQKQKGLWFYEMRHLGYNYKITDFQCALGSSQLKKLDKFIQRRRIIAKIYSRAFKDNDFFDLPIEKEGVKSSWHLYPIRLKNKYKGGRRKIFEKLRKKRLGIQVHYIPLYKHPYYQQLGYKKEIFLGSEDFYQRAISLPMYPAIKDREVRYVIRTLKDVFKKYT